MGLRVRGYVRFWFMDCRNGGPMLRTMPDRMYWKHEIRNRVVFSEFSMFVFSALSLGGINLGDVSM